MRKLFLAVLVLVSVQVFGQNPTNYLLRNTRERLISGMYDSMFRIPRYNGTPSGVRVSETSAIDGAIAMDTTNHRMYIFSGNAWVRLAAFGEIVGSTNSNVGSAYRLAIPNTNNIKTLGANYGIILDSATSNQIGIKADSATLAAYFLRRKDSATGTNLNGYLTRSSLPTYYPGIDDVLAVGQKLTADRAINGNTNSYGLRIDSLTSFSIYDYDGSFTVSNNSTFSGYYNYIQAGQYNTKIASYVPGSDAEFFTSAGSKAYADFNSAFGNKVSRYQLWGDSSRYRFVDGDISRTVDVFRINHSSFTFQTDSLFATNLPIGGVAADSVLVVGSNGRIKKRNAADFGGSSLRFGVSGEDATAGQNRSFTLDGYTFAWPDLSNFADTTNWKPMVVNTTGSGGGSVGDMRKATYWPTGGSISDSSKFTLQRDTIALASFGAGSTAAGDTAAFSTTAVYGSFYNSGSDTLVITSFRVGLQGTSPSVLVKVYYNDTLNVTAGATPLVTAGNTCTDIYTGTSVTSLNNTKIPPGNWVWVSTPTVTTKPTYFTLTLLGYKSRR